MEGHNIAQPHPVAAHFESMAGKERDKKGEGKEDRELSAIRSAKGWKGDSKVQLKNQLKVQVY